MKKTKRKGFNFYRSYFDVYMELDAEQKIQFIDALLMRQFCGVEPELDGIVKFAYMSQKHSIDKQIKGFEDATGIKLTPPKADPPKGSPMHPQGNPNGNPPSEVQEKEKEKGYISKPKTAKTVSVDWGSILENWNKHGLIQHRKVCHKAKTQIKKLIRDGYTWDDIDKAIANAKRDDHHIKSNFKYLTLEFITRSDKLERFMNMGAIDARPKKRVAL